MELRHLRYFVAVADELSFTRGAEKLRIAQPSLTRQIRDLETELGVRLLDRTKKKVNLTKEGEFFLERAKRLIGFSVEMVQSVHELDHKTSHTVNIGYVANPFHGVLPASLTAFEKEFPDISINLFGIPPEEQISAVKAGKLDIGFVGLFDPSYNADVQFLVVGSYKAVALFPKTSPHGKRVLVRLKDLAQDFFVAPSEKCYPGYDRWFTAICNKVGIRSKIVQVYDSDSDLIQSIRSGLGIALLPDQIKNVPHENVIIRNITPPALFSSTIVWKRDNPSSGLKAYLQVVTKITTGKNAKERRSGHA